MQHTGSTLATYRLTGRPTGTQAQRKDPEPLKFGWPNDSRCQYAKHWPIAPDTSRACPRPDLIISPWCHLAAGTRGNRCYAADRLVSECLSLTLKDEPVLPVLNLFNG